MQPINLPHASPWEGTWDHDDIITLPTKVSELASIKVVQVSCGSCHSIALSDGGKTYIWGSVPSVGFSSRPLEA